MPGLVKGEKSEHVVSRIHWLVRTKTSSHLPKDPNFFFNIFFKEEKYGYFTENIYRREQQDGGECGSRSDALQTKKNHYD